MKTSSRVLHLSHAQCLKLDGYLKKLKRKPSPADDSYTVKSRAWRTLYEELTQPSIKFYITVAELSVLSSRLTNYLAYKPGRGLALSIRTFPIKEQRAVIAPDLDQAADSI